ncbi:MAG: hypothetical protein HC936_02015 [Leptolyngbyaceae cyanobacterium SU_3_3]|nr:hypothetical protein [Leptolyngbyaceae cyanobacterium SU_3_3]
MVDQLDLRIQNLLKTKILLTLVYAIAYKSLLASGEMLALLQELLYAISAIAFQVLLYLNPKENI